MNSLNPTPTPYPALTEHCPSCLHYAEGCKGKENGEVRPITDHEDPEAE